MSLFTTPEVQVMDRALDMLDRALTSRRCTAVGQASPTHNVICQLNEHNNNTDHQAYVPGIGNVTWRDVPTIHPSDSGSAS